MGDPSLPDAAQPSVKVVYAVARSTNSDPLELPPLFHTISPEALDEVVTSLARGTVAFEYAGHAVTVHSDGRVELTDIPHGDVGHAEPTKEE